MGDSCAKGAGIISVVLFLIYKRVRTYTLRMFPYVYENCNLYSRYLGGGGGYQMFIGYI